MSSARDQILAGVRRALGRGGLGAEAKAALEKRLARPERNLVPRRAQLDAAARTALFVAQAEQAAATVAQVRQPEDVPGAVAEFLAAQNLPASLRVAPDPTLQALPWSTWPLLKIEAGAAEPNDRVSLTGAFAGIAETGTLMLTSGPRSPTTLNFLPENHIVMLRARQIVGPFEDAWDRLRAAHPGGALPRTVNFITGPSRSADIEQQLQMGAHGPRRLHIILVTEDGNGQGQG